MSEVDELADLFQKAVTIVGSGAFSASDNDKLKLYAYFKQASSGECNTPRPGFFDFVGKAKWDAWKSLGSMQGSDAMKGYVSMVDALAPGWREGVKQAPQVQKPKGSAFGGPVFSQMSKEGGDNEKPASTLHEFATDGDIEKVKAAIEVGSNIDSVDEEGRTALHLAADRNNIEVVELLIKLGANANAQDSQGQTALHYAAVCENVEVAKILVAAGARADLGDAAGETALEMSASDEIRNILTASS